MQNITIERWDVNIAALDAELRAALGELVSGISTGPYGVQVHLSDDVTPASIQQARQIITSHDPKILTPKQQARQQRQQKLSQARQNNTAEIDLSNYSGQSSDIQALAQKIAWLEQEIHDLRDE